jgi:hypothetical protein
MQLCDNEPVDAAAYGADQDGNQDGRQYPECRRAQPAR